MKGKSIFCTQLLILVFTCFTPISLQCQVFFPALVSREEIRAFRFIKAIKDSFPEAKTSPEEVRIASGKIAQRRREAHVRNERFIQAEPSNLTEAFAQLNEASQENFFVTLGANSGLVLAPVSIGSKIQLTRFYPDPKNRLIDPIYLYVEYKTGIVSSYDSIDIRKVFLFPETNQNTFLLGLDIQRLSNSGNWVGALQLEGALSKIRSQDKKSYFEYYGCTAGLRGERRNITLFTGASTGWCMIHLFTNLLFIEPKYHTTAKIILEEPNLASIFKSVGVSIAIGTLNQGVFITAKNFLYGMNLNPTKLGNNVEFTDYVVTVGYRVYFTRGLLRLSNWP